MKLCRILLTLLFFACVMPTQAKIYLVCVGIADYPGRQNDLRISDNDAQTIARVFRTTKHAQVDVLTNQTATQSAVLTTMHTSFAAAKSSDIVIFYFSGHGHPGSLVCYDGFLSYQRIFNMLRECKAKNKVIIADACYSGKMRTGEQQIMKYKSQNVMFFLSSRTNEMSQESRYKNSLFTIFLERGLRGGADVNYDRIITARELYNFVHQGVIETSRNTQHPVMWGNFDNNMAIIKW